MGNDLEYVDYSVFLGMNAASDRVRLSCKAFVVERLKTTMWMSWDHIGRCDDVIWRYSRKLQDLYYPFMDGLHSHRCIQREGYEESTLRLALADPRLQRLPVFQRLLVARALERAAVVYSVDPAMLREEELPIRRPAAPGAEREFPEWLEALYRTSLQLRVPLFDEGAV
jgi:hypothetical protein